MGGSGSHCPGRTIEPVLAASETDGVPAGNVFGLHQIALVRAEGEIKVELDLTLAVGVPDAKEDGMAKWTFEPGHTAAEFRARHMMVTWVRGHFKDVHGTLEFDPKTPRASSVEAVIDARGLWTGEPERDTHLKSADFLDVENHPEIRFRGKDVELLGDHEARVTGDLTIRGVTRTVTLQVMYLGQWQTPWWEGGVDKGPKTRAGFVATTQINRHDFGVSWNDTMDRGGILVGNDIYITLDAEAILDES